MLSYYSYYSIGGYKDLFLGTNNNKEEATYYLPLLPVLEERAKNDAEIVKVVGELKSLPAIKQLSEVNSYGLPNSAKVLFSHAGYKLIYKHLEGDKYALALRDIPNQTKDESGRSIPFLFVIVGDTNADIKILDILASYMVSNIRSIETQIGKFIYTDIEKNGLRFDIAKFNSWISKIIMGNKSTSIVTTTGSVTVHAYRNRVAMLLLPDGISIQKAIAEQKISTEDIIASKISEIISKDDPDKLVEQITRISKELNEEKHKNSKMKKGILLSGLLGFILGAFVVGCSNK